MEKKPKLHEVLHSMETVKRWYYVARERGKSSAMSETLRLYKILQWMEENTDWNKFD